MPTVHRRVGFTLVELLVVVTIIVILLALLSPALSKAIYAAQKVDCLSRQRLMVSACTFYAGDHKRVLPPNALPGQGSATAYDIRMWLDDNGVVTPYAVNPGNGSGVKTPNLQLGLLPQAGYLPQDKLGGIMHCPTMYNMGNPGTAFGTGAGKYSGVGMDVINDYGVGASWYTDPDSTALRIIIGYHYRAASWEKSRISGVAKGRMRSTDVGSDTIMTVDMPDLRFVGLGVAPGTIREENEADMRAFTHPDGYGRSFADGHASFRYDRDYDVAWEMYRRNGWGDAMAAATEQHANIAEIIYTQYMNRD